MQIDKISSLVLFDQYFQSFHMNFKIGFGHLLLLEIISFEKKFKTVAQTLVT